MTNTRWSLAKFSFMGIPTFLQLVGNISLQDLFFFEDYAHVCKKQWVKIWFSLDGSKKRRMLQHTLRLIFFSRDQVWLRKKRYIYVARTMLQCSAAIKSILNKPLDIFVVTSLDDRIFAASSSLIRILLLLAARQYLTTLDVPKGWIHGIGILLRRWWLWYGDGSTLLEAMEYYEVLVWALHVWCVYKLRKSTVRLLKFQEHNLVFVSKWNATPPTDL